MFEHVLLFLFPSSLVVHVGLCSGVWHGMEPGWQASGHSVQRWESSHLWSSQVHYTCAGVCNTQESGPQYTETKPAAHITTKWSWYINEQNQLQIYLFRKTPQGNRNIYNTWHYQQCITVLRITGNQIFVFCWHISSPLILFFVSWRRAWDLRATGELVLCGSVGATTCWCQDLTGTQHECVYKVSETCRIHQLWKKVKSCPLPFVVLQSQWEGTLPVLCRLPVLRCRS